jgi:hypothetical protein
VVRNRCEERQRRLGLAHVDARMLTDKTQLPSAGQFRLLSNGFLPLLAVQAAEARGIATPLFMR